MTIKRPKVKTPRAKERKDYEIREEKKVMTMARVKARTRKAQVYVTLVESRTSCQRLLEEQYSTGSK